MTQRYLDNDELLKHLRRDHYFATSATRWGSGLLQVARRARGATGGRVHGDLDQAAGAGPADARVPAVTMHICASTSAEALPVRGGPLQHRAVHSRLPHGDRPAA